MILRCLLISPAVLFVDVAMPSILPFIRFSQLNVKLREVFWGLTKASTVRMLSATWVHGGHPHQLSSSMNAQVVNIEDWEAASKRARSLETPPTVVHAASSHLDRDNRRDCQHNIVGVVMAVHSFA